MNTNEKTTLENLWDAAMEREEGKLDFHAADLPLPLPERRAVVLGNFHYQILNGGFAQWIDNGYCAQAEEAVAALLEIGTANALAAAGMVEQLEKYFSDEGWIYATQKYDDEFSADEFDLGMELAGEFDGRYDTFSDELLGDIENYLAGLAA